jgi:outer membrane receptor protein involved in Fe transport
MDTLPSMNLSLEPVEDLILRFGVAKVMARPQIGNTLAGTNYLVPTSSLAATGPNFTAAIGNVKLEPFRATTYDLSVEWYFAPESLLSFAYFYKDIDTYIQILRQDLPYASLTTLNPSAFDPAFCTGVCTASTVFQLTAAVNTEKKEKGSAPPAIPTIVKSPNTRQREAPSAMVCSLPTKSKTTSAP